VVKDLHGGLGPVLTVLGNTQGLLNNYNTVWYLAKMSHDVTGLRDNFREGLLTRRVPNFRVSLPQFG
jgi:hypothetical protein